MSAYRAEDEDGLSVVHETPSGGEAELAEIARKLLLASTDRRYEAGEEAGNERAFLTDAQVEPGMLAIPDHLAIAQPRRTPVVLHQAAGLVAAEPSGEVLEL